MVWYREFQKKVIHLPLSRWWRTSLLGMLGCALISTASVAQSSLQTAVKILEKAQREAEQVKPADIRYGLFMEIVEILMHAERPDLARNALAKATQALEQLSKEPYGEQYYSSSARDLARWQIQLGLYEQASATIQRLKHESERDSLRQSLALAYAKAGMVEQAVRTAHSIQHSTDRKHTLLRIAFTLMDQGALNAVPVVLSAIESESDRKRLKESFARALAKHGYFEEALRIAHEVQHLPTVYEVLLKQLEAGQREPVLREVRALESAGWRAKALSAVAKEYHKAGQHLLARQILDEALDCSRMEQGTFLRLDALIEIAKVQSQMGLRELAEQTFREATQLTEKQRKGHQLYVESLRLALALHEAGFQQEARLAFVDTVRIELQKMPQNVNAIGCFPPEIVALDRAIKLGYYDVVLDEVRNLENEFARAYALRILASLLEEVGKYEGLLEIAHTIQDPKLRSAVMESIASTFAHAGQVKMAWDAIRQSEPSESRRWALQRCAGALIQKGRQSDALTFALEIDDPKMRDKLLAQIAVRSAKVGEIERAKQMARTVSDPLLRIAILCEVAQILAQAGNSMEARQLFAEAFQLATQTVDPYWHSDAFSQIAKAQARAGFIEEAYRTFEAMRKPHNPWWLKSLAIAQAELGWLEQALQTAERITHSREMRVETYIGMAKAVMKEIKPELAQPNLPPSIKVLYATP